MKAFIFLSVCPYMVTGNNPEALIDDVGGVLCFLFGRTAPSLHQTYFSSGVLAECDWWSRDVHFSGWEKGHKRICVHTHHHTTTILSLLFSKCLTWIFPCFYIIKSYFVTCYSSDVLAKKKKVNRDRLSGKDEFFLKEIFGTNFVSLCELNGEESLGLLQEIYMNMNGGKKMKAGPADEPGQPDHTRNCGILINGFVLALIQMSWYETPCLFAPALDSTLKFRTLHLSWLVQFHARFQLWWPRWIDAIWKFTAGALVLPLA